jgi:hypothetical protein
MFQEAERLSPPPGLWRQIEARVELHPGGRTQGAGSWGTSPWRMAASVALAAGLLGLGFFLQKRPDVTDAKRMEKAGTAANPAATGQDTEWVDPELLSWHAGLGELDEDADEAGEAEEVL